MISHAQIAFKSSTDSVSCTWYAGTLAGTKVSVNDANAKTTALFSIRAGGSITWAPTKWFSVFGLGIGDINQTDTLTPTVLFCVKFKPVKSVVITLGKTSSVVTEMFRPVPSTPDAQFETWTTSQIPGAALGGKINISFGKHDTVILGNFWRGAEASSELGFRYKKFSIGGFYMNKSKQFGGAVSFVSEKFKSVITFSDKKSTGIYNSVGVPWIKNLSVYSDLGFNPDNWKTMRNEFGLLENAKLGHLQIMIGVGFDQQLNFAKGYVRINNI